MRNLQIGPEDSVEEVVAKTTIAREWVNDAPDIPASADAVRMRVSAHIPARSPAVTEVFEPLFRRLKYMSGGALTVDSHWGATLHGERDGMAALLSGKTDMCPVYSAWDPASFPAAQALGLPFQFSSAEAATAVSEELYARFFRADFERKGILMGRMAATSEYNLFSVSPIRRLEDLNGLTVACSAGLESQVIAALGAVPVACSTPEAAERFAAGGVTAVSISDSAAHTVGIYRTARYRTSANLVRVNLEYGLSRQFYDTLNPKLRCTLNAWLRGAAQAGAQLFYGLAGARARDVFRSDGIEFIALSDNESRRWRVAVEPVAQTLSASLKQAGYPASELLTAVNSGSRKYADWSSDSLMKQSLTHPLVNILPRAGDLS
jgi:TRAP-type C4-dicarboxylate transport system substrate-binding protein